MSTTHNLSGKEAVDKLRGLINDTPTCLFGSGLKEVPMHLCPMQVQQVDPQGCLWFFSGADSVHNRQLAADSRAHLIFCNPAKVEYFTLFGESTVSTDSQKISELWNPLAEAWFPGGPNDPNLTLIRVRPVMTHYWDTESGKLITFAKILSSALAGTPRDPGGQDGALIV
ncbi:pyridoxamine 5'-phosphate oxidase family protein [bacterium]|nr:pyridoxamine 5'-phosphate oxidase family protein [bacterium]